MFCLISLVTGVYADVHVAASCALEAVKAAVSAASVGDTVLIPAGTCVWSDKFIIPAGITIRGAGVDKTIIKDGTATNVALLGGGGDNWRLCHMTFSGYDGVNFPNAGIDYSWLGGRHYRIDHCKFLNLPQLFILTGRGLFDHNCVWPIISTNWTSQPINIYGNGDVEYTRPLGLGGPDATYLEDNDFHHGVEQANASGGNCPVLTDRAAGRMVVRYNRIANSHLEIYWITPGGLLGNLKTEVYNNTFVADPGLKAGVPDHALGVVAGGAFLAFNNTITGRSFQSKQIELEYQRMCTYQEPYGKCDGTSSWDGNLIPAGQPGAGYPCFGQPGRGVDEDGDGVQDSAPVYEWNNTLNGANFGFGIRNFCAEGSAYIVEGRDYYRDTKMPGYTPYTYPHPWQTSMGDGPDTSAPPAPVAVYDGTSIGNDISVTHSTSSLSAVCRPVDDPQTSVPCYEYAIGTTPGATNVVGWTRNYVYKNTNLVTHTGLNLTVGQTYYISMRAVNGDWMAGPAATSNGQIVASSTVAAVADFNGDGHADWVVRNAATRQTGIWYLNNNVFVGSAYGPTLAAGWGLRAVADFNLDSHSDYGLFAPSTNQTAIWYLSGPTRIGGAYGPSLPSGWELMGAADFNGDGNSDYVLYRASTRQTAVWYLDNNVLIGGDVGPTLPPGWSLMGVADFNHDGHTDYALFHPNTGYTAIWYLSGPTLIGGAFGPTVPSGWILVATTDFNGDSNPDYLLYNARTHETAIWYLNNNLFVSSAPGPTLPAGWNLTAP